MSWGIQNNLKTYWIKLILLLVILCSLILTYFLWIAPNFEIHNLQDLVQEIQKFGYIAWLILGVLIILQAVVPYAPFAILAGVGVLLFGYPTGFLISFISALIGSSLMFVIIRWGAKEPLVVKLSQNTLYEKFAVLLSEKGFRVVLIARLIPFLPLTFVNASAAVSPVSFRTFFFASFIGKIPIIAAESAVGAGLLNWREQLPLLLGGGAVLLLLLLLSWFLRKKF